MPTQKDLDNAIAAYRHSLGKAQAAGAEALEALEKATLIGDPDDGPYAEKIKRAIIASENWGSAAQLALKVITEISLLEPSLKAT